MSNKLVNIEGKPISPEPPQLPELYTYDEVTNSGEVLNTTKSGCIFVMSKDEIFLFQPVATTHFDKKLNYYTRLEFK